MSQILHRAGFTVLFYTLTDEHFLLKIWVGENRYFVTGEDDNILCVLTSGNRITVKGVRI